MHFLQALSILAAFASQESHVTQGALPVLRVGELVTGKVTDDSPSVHTPTLDADYTTAPTVGVRYQVRLEKAGPYQIELRSYDFDSYMVLEGPDGEILVEDDDGLVGVHSRVVFDVDGGESLVCIVCALHGDRGDFEVRLLDGGPADLGPTERRALQIEDLRRRIERSEVHGTSENPDIVKALSELALLLQSQGLYDQARSHLERALAIRERVLGPDHPSTAVALNNLAMLLKDQGALDEARPLMERALAIDEAAFGSEHLDTARDLNNLSTLLYGQGHLGEAQPLLERALVIYEKALGPEHPNTSVMLNNLAMLLKDRGFYEDARRLLERALAIREKTLGDEHASTAGALTNLASLLMTLEHYDDARPLYERALAIYARVLGPEHPATATSMMGLADLLEQQGLYDEARTLLVRALAIREKVRGPNHPDTASSQNNLAAFFMEQGLLDEARSLHERALATRRDTLGREHPNTATSVMNLAEVLFRQGLYDEARPLYEEALEIKEKVLGSEHPDTAKAIGNLAKLLMKQGLYDEARPLYERALAIHEETLGPEHTVTATSLANLALLLTFQGRFDEAQPLYERALAIKERVLGSEHPDTAMSLHNQAALFREQGLFAKAQLLSERALAIREKALGSEHPDTAMSLHLLGNLLRDQGRFEAARPLFERALAAWEKVLGAEHPYTAICLNNLALLLADMGDVDAAWGLTQRAARGRNRHLARVLATQTEHESYSYLATSFWQLEIMLSLIDRSSSLARDETYEEVLAWKGRVQRLLRSSRSSVAGLTERQEEILAELHATQSALSQVVFAQDLSDRDAHDAHERELLEKRNVLELEWARTLGLGGQGEVSFESLIAKLPASSALVDFFVQRLYEPAQHEGNVHRRGSFTKPHLTVWVSRAADEEPVRLDLGAASEIEASMESFLGNLIAHRGIGAGEAASGERCADLRGRLWDPISALVEGAETVIVSPDGFLGGFPFEVLQDTNGDFLIEKHAFVYVEDPSSLALDLEERTTAFDSLLGLGGVDFRKRADLEESNESVAAVVGALRGGFDYWEPLASTVTESNTVVALHEDTFGEGTHLLLQGPNGTEERLKHELPRYAVAHLATHGFFQPDGLPNMWEEAKNASGKRQFELREPAKRLVGNHPGLLSGLVCAGANATPEDGRDDGYLTAEEVSWLDLSKVELVVLSACETGLGRAQSGEGMLGLRRAFRTAGAKTVISSLWSVRDDSTAELMRGFYKNLWVDGMGKLEALRATQLAMLKQNRIERGDALPATWGAFVLSGEWE